MTEPKVSVIVASYGRAALLERCLVALERQTRLPDETIVVLRSSDAESCDVILRRPRRWLALVEVEERGVVAALRSGVAHSSGDIVLFTDDDAVPKVDWLERMLGLISQPGVGAAGGRDVVAGQTQPRTTDVGRLTRYGKAVGNHHLGIGEARNVDVLKGVCMGFRAECLALPRAGVLRGDGAEVHFEMLCSRWAQRLGWRLVYDPTVEVDHIGAERIGLDRRERPAAAAVRDASHNFVIATAGLDRTRLPRQAIYSLALGSRDAPGMGRGVVAAVRREREVLRRLAPSLVGSTIAIGRLMTRSGPLMMTTVDLRSSHRRPADKSVH